MSAITINARNVWLSPIRESIRYSWIFTFVLVACNSSKDSHLQDSRPNIIWINAEDISPVFGCYGDNNAYTPNIDGLAKNGAVYRRVYTTSPICSPSRSTMITGIHSTTLGTQHLRSEVRIPDELKILPELLNDAGYFTTIYGKTDYNFDAENIYDYWHNDDAPWRKREDTSPFFSVFTFGYSHEGRGNSYQKYKEMKAMLSDEAYHDSLSVAAPPYFPNTPAFRNLWTRYYDLISLFDQQVGTIINNLREDGLLENTIVFVFSDHGFGMPRHKRWLNRSGLQVPLVIYLPEKYRYGNHAFELQEETKISFIDLAPTTLNLAEVNPPLYMQGRVFLGRKEKIDQEPAYLYAAKSRADNMYDMSRAVIGERYIYIRHFLPYLPYIQSGKIFSNEKESFALLRRYRQEGILPPVGEMMFHVKPLEELYDLQEDPHELNNLVCQDAYQGVLKEKREVLKAEMIRIKDAGFIHEVEMQRQAQGSTPYEIGQGYANYARLFDAAMMVGMASEAELLHTLANDAPEIRYWALVGLRQLDSFSLAIDSAVKEVLSDDESSANQMLAAEIMLRNQSNDQALQVLKENLQSNISVNALMAARTLELIGQPAQKLLPEIKAKLASLKSHEPGKHYIDYNYAAFISWSLEEIVQSQAD